MKITVQEFQQDVSRYQDEAQRGPVAITKDGQPHAVLVSAQLFETLLKGRSARRVEDLDEDTLAAIRGAEMNEEHRHLDALIEDWRP